MSRDYFKEVVAGRTLTKEESKRLMYSLVSGDLAAAQVAGVLTALAVRGLDLDLLDGFSEALSELARPLDLGDLQLIDVCGTGGDGKGSFNISTTVAFVLAGAGYHVAKHGNVAVSSRCGSSDVLKELGIPLSVEPDYLKRSLDQNRVCFIHAPHFHPAFKHIAPIRHELGIRTVFNALGPLLNPARVAFRYTGVYGLELQRLYSYLLQRRSQRFAVVYSLDGYDEISLTGSSRILSDLGNWQFQPEDLGFSPISPDDLVAPSTASESAELIELILAEGGKLAVKESSFKARLEVVLVNAAVALWCFNGAKGELSLYLDLVRESVESGRAYAALLGCRKV